MILALSTGRVFEAVSAQCIRARSTSISLIVFIIPFGAFAVFTYSYSFTSNAYTATIALCTEFVMARSTFPIQFIVA
jgi:hypothetical protein